MGYKSKFCGADIDEVFLILGFSLVISISHNTYLTFRASYQFFWDSVVVCAAPVLKLGILGIFLSNPSHEADSPWPLQWCHLMVFLIFIWIGGASIDSPTSPPLPATSPYRGISPLPPARSPSPLVTVFNRTERYRPTSLINRHPS